MRTLTILAALLLKLTCAGAQDWIKSRCDTSAWVHIDTLRRYSDSAGWVYSDWAYLPNIVPDSSHIYRRREGQKRVGKTSGYLMERIRTTEWVLRPKEKTMFEKIIDSVSNP